MLNQRAGANLTVRTATNYPDTAYAYAKALKDLQVPVELHIYERGGYGGHGYGIRKLNTPTDGWHDKALRWIQQNTSE